VLTVARLHPQKRLDLLVAAAASWPPGPDRPRFLVAGDGPLLEALQRQARAARAPVTFLGARDDVMSLLADADVVAMTSDWEARPLVAQEALCAGVPLVATDVGGVRDLVGEAALLVPPGDVAALSDGIRRVLTDQVLRERLTRRGPVQAATWPTVEEMVDELVATYHGLTARIGRARP
jgi:glycosyltransferase involved in cell wall biosynthesis